MSWEKISEKIKRNSLFVNDLNYLCMSKEEEKLNQKIDELFNSNERRKCFKLLSLFLAKRVEKENFMYLDNAKIEKQYNYHNLDSIKEFINLSGLKNNLFLLSKFNDVYSYLYGIEVGLSNNDKKNKSGEFMEQSVIQIFKKHNIDYEMQKKYSDVLKIELNQDKKFDFVFTKNNIQYCIEVNFYNTSGSKINSELDRFVELSNSVKKFKNKKFIWIVDGKGIVASKPKFKIAFEQIEFLFNLESFEDFIKNNL